ncbi:MAG: hypothetical protein ABIL05_04785, partial [candidate division WOR-3 bacterium]
MNYFFLFILFLDHPINRFSSEEYYRTPESGYLNIGGWRNRGVGDIDTSFSAWVEVGFDSADLRLYAGEVYLDDQLIPWVVAERRYRLTSQDGFVYQPNHQYTLRVNGSPEVPPFSVNVRSLRSDFSITTPKPGSRVINLKDLRIAWQPTGESVFVDLIDSVGYHLNYRGIDTGTIQFSASRVESLKAGSLYLSVEHDTGYEILVNFSLCFYSCFGEGITCELVDPLGSRRPSIFVFPNPVRDRFEILFRPGENGLLELNLYDICGVKQACLFKEKVMLGDHRIVLRLSDRSNQMLAP